MSSRMQAHVLNLKLISTLEKYESFLEHIATDRVPKYDNFSASTPK